MGVGHGTYPPVVSLHTTKIKRVGLQVTVFQIAAAVQIQLKHGSATRSPSGLHQPPVSALVPRHAQGWAPTLAIVILAQTQRGRLAAVASTWTQAQPSAAHLHSRPVIFPVLGAVLVKSQTRFSRFNCRCAVKPAKSTRGAPANETLLEAEFGSRESNKTKMTPTPRLQTLPSQARNQTGIPYHETRLLRVLCRALTNRRAARRGGSDTLRSSTAARLLLVTLRLYGLKIRFLGPM